MAVEENLRSKTLYKAEILLLKIIPMLLALVYLSNTIISYFFDLDLIIFSYIGSVSILSLGFLYLSSYVFRFCEYHRMFLHFVVINELINAYDTHIGIPITDKELFCIHMIIAGISLFLILYLHVAINAQYHDYSALFKSWNRNNVDHRIIESAIVFWFCDADYPGKSKVFDYFQMF